MSRFKICPDCHAKISPNVSECPQCDCDLIGVPVTDDEQEAAKEITPPQTAPPSAEFVRICSECGEQNPVIVRKCQKCGEEIADVLPVASTATTINTAGRSTFTLRSLDAKISFTLPPNGAILGRENELKDYLGVKSYVSRKHCRLALENGAVYLEDLGSANGTYVNNQRINAKTQLKPGDEIGLGGAVFNGSRQEQAAYFLIG